MNYDIRVCKSVKKGRYTSVEQNEDLTIFRLFFSDILEFKKATTFVTDCIIDGMEAKEIFELAKRRTFFEIPEKIKNAKEKAKEDAKFKIRKILGSYYISYTR